MTATSYVGKIQENGAVLIPKEAQEALGLQPGDEVQVQLQRPVILEKQARTPNSKAAAALQEIAERQKNQPYSDGSDTLRLVREAREGAMYDYDPAK